MALQIEKEVIYNYECWTIINQEMPDTIKKRTEYPACYVMINKINGGKNKININTYFYADATKEQVIEQKQYTFTPSVSEDSPNFIQQGYEYLKTLPEFADAVDC